VSGASDTGDPIDAIDAEWLRRTHPTDWRNPKPPAEPYDLVILGAGPAGLAGAELAARHGLRVALIERRGVGGNSLHAGSVPSKAIIGAAPRDRGGPRPEFSAVRTHMHRVRARIAGYRSVDRIVARGIDLYFATARFATEQSVLADGVPLGFKKALIATGARPEDASIPGLDAVDCLTSETIFDLEALPARLAVVGGGSLGCELAQAFARLGSHVSLMQRQPKFLPGVERDAADLLTRSLELDGVETRLNTEVIAAHREGGERVLDVRSGELKFSIGADAVLLSTGRVPNVQDLDLGKAGVRFDAATGVTVDDFLATSNPNIFAAGDVCVRRQFAHVAEATARLAVHNAFTGGRDASSHLLIPRCTYCRPEIAQIGLHIWEAADRGIPIKSYTVLMQDVDRAITDGLDEGFVKLYVREGGDEIVGATIVAARASEMINEVSVIMSAGIGMRRLATMLHTYPAQSGAIYQAAMAFARDQPAERW
jgi:pyruvate/2-oxoglutarate dehydrogenase complex dihydrolipoamide dehydrogenase (E3) component